MKKRNERHEKRVKRLVVACGLCGIILAASTYAWFIGMKTVDVGSFNVDIAAIDGLSLSLDGKTFNDKVTINGENYATVNDSNNTNSWGGTGLVPMSSVGIIDSESSRLTMYEKGSFTQVPGGYRVMASRVKNTKDDGKEADGYVAFDLFIKNLSGEEYYSSLNYLNEEAIYLTPNSAVTTSTTGGVAGTGIENSVRVGFAQIGRVKATTTDQATITGITCAGGTDSVGICNDRTAQIWEPNDTAHVQNAINYYKTNCDKRTGEDVTKKDSYTTRTDKDTTTCTVIEDKKAYSTYAISGVIDYTDNVNVYDGKDFNTYETSVVENFKTIKDARDYVAIPANRKAVMTAAGDGKLLAFPYFTDSDKDRTGTDRPAFFTLAPNSITKVRVYIWIEGQDVDNYDFASLGKQISVSFGFSKEQLYGEDFNYSGDPALDPEYQTRNPEVVEEP